MNRSGHSAALVMPMRGVTVRTGGSEASGAVTVSPDPRIGAPSWSRVMASAWQSFPGPEQS